MRRAPAVKRILHRHAYKYSPERTVYAVRGLGDLKGEAAGVLNAFLQPLNHQAWSPSPPHPPSDRVRWTQTKRDRAHCHAPLKHRRVLPSALGPWRRLTPLVRCVALSAAADDHAARRRGRGAHGLPALYLLLRAAAARGGGAVGLRMRFRSRILVHSALRHPDASPLQRPHASCRYAR